MEIYSNKSLKSISAQRTVQVSIKDVHSQGGGGLSSADKRGWRFFRCGLPHKLRIFKFMVYPHGLRGRLSQCGSLRSRG